MSAAKSSARCSREGHVPHRQESRSRSRPASPPTSTARPSRSRARRARCRSCCTTRSRSSSKAAQIKVDPRDETKRARAQWGTSRTLVANLVAGVTKGFEQRLEINGVGYRAAVQGKNLQLALGYSHDIVYPIPEGITHRDAAADRDRDHRHRPAEGRPGRRRDPRLPAAGALQGQGREVRRRTHLPQGRQEEVTEPPMTKLNDRIERRQGPRARRARARGARPQAAVGVPLLQAHLRAGDRRRCAA